MIVRILVILLLILPVFAGAKEPSLGKVRTDFFAMDKKDTCGALELFNTIQQLNWSTSPVLTAYAGAAEAASASCVKGGLKKLEYFSRGKKNLETAVKQAPGNAEIRFLRFATQSQSPDFLNYDNTAEDKKIIIERLPALLAEDNEDGYWTKAATFLSGAKKLNNSEREYVLSLLKSSSRK